jgi:transposase
LREVFNALRWIVPAGALWRLMSNDLPPWEAVYQQMQRWLQARVFEAIVHDLRVVLWLTEGRQEQPSAAIFDSRTLQSAAESGPRAGYNGAKRKRGSKVHMAVDTLGHLLALHVTAASEQDRAQVAQLAAQVQAVTGETVEVAFVDQGVHAQSACFTGVEAMSTQIPSVRTDSSSMHIRRISSSVTRFILTMASYVAAYI